MLTVTLKILEVFKLIKRTANNHLSYKSCLYNANVQQEIAQQTAS